MMGPVRARGSAPLPVSPHQAHPPANPAPSPTKSQPAAPPGSPAAITGPPATRSCSDAARTSYLVSPLLSRPFHLLLSQWPAGSFKKQVDS